MTETLATKMAAFAVNTPDDAFPADVRQAALWHVVDTIGVCVAGASPQDRTAPSQLPQRMMFVQLSTSLV